MSVSGTISIVVGTAGNGGQIYTSPPTNGWNSSFGSIIATGGGSGAGESSDASSLGYTDGGGTGYFAGINAGSTGTGGEVHKGGNGAYTVNSLGVAGGGGAGGAGSSGGGIYGGNGGIGLISNITGTPTYYGGGGGGRGDKSGVIAGSGGLGGGGNAGSSGLTNTGGGGGGSTIGNGGNGG